MYEDGMQIVWDVVTKRITVIFRGNIVVLPTTFFDQKKGVEAGEEYCRLMAGRPKIYAIERQK